MKRRRPKTLIELERADSFAVAKDDNDPRGWAVVGCDGNELGKVRTLLVDTELLRAVYLVCDLTSNRAVLLPITYARLDKENSRVIFDVIDAQGCDKLQAYTGAAPDAAQQDAI